MCRTSSSMQLTGLTMLGCFVLFALIAPWLSGYTYDTMHLNSRNTSPNTLFWFGTDELGRDLFTRVWIGARISLFVGIAAALLDLLIGITWGSLAAFSRSWIDELLMRCIDLFSSLPHLLIVILLVVWLGHGLVPLIVALACTGWMTMARIVRAELVRLQKQDFVLASLMLGSQHLWILKKHLIPNAMPSIVATLTLSIPSAVFSEAFLSFLGLGVQAPFSSLGTMVNEGLPSLVFHPWRTVVPLLILSWLLLSFQLISQQPNLVKRDHATLYS